MTINRIAKALCAPTLLGCSYAITSPGDDPDPLIKMAYHNVQELRRQRAGLIELWPAQKEKYDEQFNDKVMEVARDLYSEAFTFTD